MSESNLVYECMRELGKHGIVFRCNSGMVRLPNGKYFHGMPKGFTDIMLILPGGMVCFVETKVKPNKPSPDQEAFIAKMIRQGCRAGVAYSVDDALRICGLK